MLRADPKIVLISSIILSLVIAYWGVAFNKATISVESELKSYTVKISDDPNVCADQTCSYKVKPRSYTVLIEAKGYTQQEVELKLERGDIYKISYAPVKLPEITEADGQMKEYNPAQFRSDINGEQILWIDLGETLGEQQITRFPNPLNSPKISLSPSGSVALISDGDKFWLVDVDKKSKSNFEFSLEESPTRFRLISDNFVVIRTDSQHKIYNLENGQNANFPIENIDHVIANDDGTIVILSKSNLDQVENSNDDTNLLSLLNSTGEELLKSKPQGNISLYFYLSNENKYIKISEFKPEEYGTSYLLKKAKDNIYLDTNKGEFVLNL